MLPPPLPPPAPVRKSHKRKNAPPPPAYRRQGLPKHHFTRTGKALASDHYCDFDPHAIPKEQPPIDEFLLYARNLTLQSEGPDPTNPYMEPFTYNLPVLERSKVSTTTAGSAHDAFPASSSGIVPMEEDAVALKYLQKFGNSVPLAVFVSNTSFSMKLAESAARWRSYYQGKALLASQGWKGVWYRRSERLSAVGGGGSGGGRNMTVMANLALIEGEVRMNMPLSRDVDPPEEEGEGESGEESGEEGGEMAPVVKRGR